MRIGHASISENGTMNGTFGDQTGREVCIREWYSKPWVVMIRASDPMIAEKMAQACEAGCMNGYIGYSQDKRNTAHSEARKHGYDLSKIDTPCATDCSAFMVLCAIAAGVTELEYAGNAPTTRTLTAAFGRTGKFLCYTNEKYLSSPDYLLRGDILVRPGAHTVMSLDNGKKAGRKDISGVARDVIAGKYGDGLDRKKRLIDAGYNYVEVQAAVNLLLR